MLGSAEPILWRSFRFLARISHEVWTDAMGGKSGARNFGSGRAGEVFRPLLVAGEVVQSRHPAMCEHTSPFGNSARGGFQAEQGFFSSGVRTRPR